MSNRFTHHFPGRDNSWHKSKPPLLRFLTQCHADFVGETSGAVANYIPELSKANPNHFGISLATIDGHVYEVGESQVPFTIQSMSKALVFALAIDTIGAERVESVIGVEPSGDAFNSIRLNAANQPFNPMVNSGAIACSGLIHEVKGDGAFEYIRTSISRVAGRDLAIDEAVYASESSTGDRNRAIGFLLRSSGVIAGDVDAVLDIYFRQCAILVTARDMAVIGATLANRGTNPVTCEQVLTPHAVTRTLSVMTSSGMYDYAGEWVYRVGMPAKSGVGGGILAALPAQLGLGIYSPCLDDHGNSVRGIKVCEALSAHFDLHMLNRGGDARNSIIADYDIGKSASRRGRRPEERKILGAHQHGVRIIELFGALNFANIDYVSRQIAAKPRPQLIIFDLRRVAAMTRAAARLLADDIRELGRFHVTAILSGVEQDSAVGAAIAEWTAGLSRLREFYLLDDAIEWAEDQIVYRHGGMVDSNEVTELAEQALLAGLQPAQIAALAELGTVRNFPPGYRIIAAGEHAGSVFFLLRGIVNVRLHSGTRLATLTAGMVFGEMALLDAHRSADVVAETSVHCLEVLLRDFEHFREDHPQIGERIMRNLAGLLAERLIVANNRVHVLTANDRDTINAANASPPAGLSGATGAAF